MPRGISVHVGVNHTIAPKILAPELKGCANDAQAMHDLALLGGFEAGLPLIDASATFDAVTTAVKEAAAKLKAGETFLFTFSGHGTRRAAQDFNEADSKDETLVLHDKLLVDNVFRRSLWPEFAEGVTCIAVSDSCASETAFLNSAVAFAAAPIEVSPMFAGYSSRGLTRERRRASSRQAEVFGFKRIAGEKVVEHYEELAPFYRTVRESLPAQPPTIKASLMMIGACQDSELASDGVPNSLFTKHLLDAIRQDSSLTYEGLLAEVKVRLGPGTTQHPSLLTLGPNGLTSVVPQILVSKPAFKLIDDGAGGQ